MEKKFQLNPPYQTPEHWQFNREELRHLSCQILAAQETDTGDTQEISE